MNIGKDLTGMTFGRLKVLRRSSMEERIEKSANWLCQCECGKIKCIKSSSLLRGASKSCGCYCKEFIGAMKRTHGQSHTRTHRAWSGMKTRVSNPKNAGAKNYIGRGITVCPRWRDSFENFFEDMGECPEGLSLDRINNDGNYEPSNCRWATNEQQQSNKRVSRYFSRHGKNMTVTQWAVYLGIDRTTIYLRLRKGWSLEDSILTPIRAGHRLGYAVYLAKGGK